MNFQARRGIGWLEEPELVTRDVSTKRKPYETSGIRKIIESGIKLIGKRLGMR